MRNLCKLGSGISVLVGVIVAAISFGLTAPLASAQDAKSEPAISAAPNTPLPAPKVKPHTGGNPYFAEFRARNAATYGHMYVLYGQVNGRGEIIKSDIVGLHPAGDRNDCENCSVASWTLGHIFFVPSETGASDGDLEEKYVTARYRVMLNAAQYKKLTAHIKELKADPPLWNALWRNCVSFGNGIAETLDLKTPGFIWLEPKQYVESLRELNGGKKQGPLKDAAGSRKTSVSSPPNSVTPATSSAPRKQEKQPVANLPSSQAAGVASGTTR